MLLAMATAKSASVKMAPPHDATETVEVLLFDIELANGMTGAGLDDAAAAGFGCEVVVLEEFAGLFK